MAPPTLVMATRNAGKVRELRDLLAGLGIELLSLADFPDLPEIPEEGATFADNAGFKAKEVARLTNLPALADDSGLEVAALGGGPGSSRPAMPRTAPGPQSLATRTTGASCLEEMQGVPWEERGPGLSAKSPWLSRMAVSLRPGGSARAISPWSLRGSTGSAMIRSFGCRSLSAPWRSWGRK